MGGSGVAGTGVGGTAVGGTVVGGGTVGTTGVAGGPSVKLQSSSQKPGSGTRNAAGVVLRRRRRRIARPRNGERLTDRRLQSVTRLRCSSIVIQVLP